jgi:hypothetical protein
MVLATPCAEVQSAEDTHEIILPVASLARASIVRYRGPSAACGWQMVSLERGAQDVHYLDAGHWIDLFSYPTLYSNKDGIANVRVSHDETHLIVQSQGYPNHPTAVFPNSDNPNSIRAMAMKIRNGDITII